MKLEYTSKHEQFLFEIFEPTLKIAATSGNPFTDLTYENLETLTSLKKMWLGKNSASQIPAEESKEEEETQEITEQAPNSKEDVHTLFKLVHQM